MDKDHNISAQLHDSLSIVGNSCIEKQEILENYFYPLNSDDEVLFCTLLLVKTKKKTIVNMYSLLFHK
jgi:hypothetical protein